MFEFISLVCLLRMLCIAKHITNVNCFVNVLQLTSNYNSINTCFGELQEKLTLVRMVGGELIKRDISHAQVFTPAIVLV